MSTRTKIVTTVLLTVGLVGVGVADFLLAGREYAAELTATSSSSAASTDGVTKAEGPEVESTLATMGFVSSPSEDLTFLAQVSRNAQVHSFAVLENGDRIGSVSWIDGDAKAAFIDLKEALLSAFSDNVQDLSDRTIQEEGKPTRNVLTFRDPALSEETLTFIRVRERLYEFHTAEGSEESVARVIETLTTR